MHDKDVRFWSDNLSGAWAQKGDPAKMDGFDDLRMKLDRMAKAASPQENATRLRAMRCPTHHKAPSNIRVAGDTLTAEFCCATFRASAMKAAQAAMRDAIR